MKLLFDWSINKMASNFSGALQLTDLNDFITPSQVDYAIEWYICSDKFIVILIFFFWILFLERDFDR